MFDVNLLLLIAALGAGGVLGFLSLVVMGIEIAGEEDCVEDQDRVADLDLRRLRETVLGEPPPGQRLAEPAPHQGTVLPAPKAEPAPIAPDIAAIIAALENGASSAGNKTPTRKFNVAKSTTSRLVTELVKTELIARERDQRNNRVVKIGLVQDSGKGPRIH